MMQAAAVLHVGGAAQGESRCIVTCALTLPLNAACQVLLYGLRGKQAPLNDEGWLGFATSFPDQTLYKTLLASTPISPSEPSRA